MRNHQLLRLGTHQHVGGGRRRVKAFDGRAADHRVQYGEPEQLGHVRRRGVLLLGLDEVPLRRVLDLLQLLQVRGPDVLDLAGHLGHTQPLDGHGLGDSPVRPQPLRPLVVRLVLLVPQHPLVAVQFDEPQRHLFVEPHVDDGRHNVVGGENDNCARRIGYNDVMVFYGSATRQ